MTAPTWDRREIAALRSEFGAFFYSPFCRSPYDHISPLTSLFPLFLAPSFPGLLPGIPAAVLLGAIYRGLISIVPSANPTGTPLRFSTSYYRPIHCLLLFAPGAPFEPDICAPLQHSRLLLFSATSSPSSPVFAPTFKLYLNRRPVIYIIDFRNAPVGIRNDFIFKRGKPG